MIRNRILSRRFGPLPTCVSPPPPDEVVVAMLHPSPPSDAALGRPMAHRHPLMDEVPEGPPQLRLPGVNTLPWINTCLVLLVVMQRWAELSRTVRVVMEHRRSLKEQASIELEPEYAMEDFTSNPNLEENIPPPSLEEVLNKVKPYIVKADYVNNEEEWVIGSITAKAIHGKCIS